MTIAYMTVVTLHTWAVSEERVMLSTLCCVRCAVHAVRVHAVLRTQCCAQRATCLMLILVVHSMSGSYELEACCG